MACCVLHNIAMKCGVPLPLQPQPREDVSWHNDGATLQARGSRSSAINYPWIKCIIVTISVQQSSFTSKKGKKISAFTHFFNILIDFFKCIGYSHQGWGNFIKRVSHPFLIVQDGVRNQAWRGKGPSTRVGGGMAAGQLRQSFHRLALWDFICEQIG